MCWGTADYLSRRHSQLVGHYKTVVHSHLTTLLFLALIIGVFGLRIDIVQVPTMVLIAAGVLNFLAFVYLYRAFHKGVVSVVAPVAYTYPAVTVILSVLFLGASLNLVRGLGISAVMVGVILLSTKVSELRASLGSRTRMKITSGLGSAIAASVLFGVVYVGVGYATPFSGFAFPPVVLRAAAVSVGLLLLIVRGETIKPWRVAFSRTTIAMGALESVGFLSFNYGIYLGPDSLPIVAALSGMGGAVAASYALLFIRERLEMNQLLGIGVSAAGVFTLLYLGG